MRWISLSLVVLLCAGVSGCFLFGSPRSPNDPVAEGYAIDPVTGWEVSKDTIWKTTRGDRTYYFYNREHMERFEREPMAYIKPDGRIKGEKHDPQTREVR